MAGFFIPTKKPVDPSELPVLLLDMLRLRLAGGAGEGGRGEEEEGVESLPTFRSLWYRFAHIQLGVTGKGTKPSVFLAGYLLFWGPASPPHPLPSPDSSDPILSDGLVAGMVYWAVEPLGLHAYRWWFEQRASREPYKFALDRCSRQCAVQDWTLNPGQFLCVSSSASASASASAPRAYCTDDASFIEYAREERVQTSILDFSGVW